MAITHKDIEMGRNDLCRMSAKELFKMHQCLKDFSVLYVDYGGEWHFCGIYCNKKIKALVSGADSEEPCPFLVVPTTVDHFLEYRKTIKTISA